MDMFEPPAADIGACQIRPGADGPKPITAHPIGQDAPNSQVVFIKLEPGVILDMTVALVMVAKDTAKGRMPVMMGISAPNIETSLAYVKAAEDNGADVLLSMPQTYVLKASEPELMARFDKISAATKLQLVLYNSPPAAWDFR